MEQGPEGWEGDWDRMGSALSPYPSGLQPGLQESLCAWETPGKLLCCRVWRDSLCPLNRSPEEPRSTRQMWGVELKVSYFKIKEGC